MTTRRNQKKEIYDSAKRGHPALEEIKVLLKYRDLIKQLVQRDIVTRYKRSVLGVAWTMLNPLGTMLILTVVFTKVFSQTESYPVFILSGLIAWNFFSQATNASMSGMLWGSSLFTRIFLPRTSFVIAAIGTGVVNMLLSLVPLFIIMLVIRVTIYNTIILLPLAILIMAIFSLGVGLLLSAYVLFFPDIGEMYPIVLTAWMYLTPIIIPEEILAKIGNGLLLKLNPLYYLIKLFRMCVYYGEWPNYMDVIVPVLISLVVLALGWLVFTKNADRFAYYI